MARRSNFLSRFPRSKGRLTQWVAVAQQGFVAVASAGATLINSFSPEQSLTVVRNRGQVSVQPQAQVADLNIIGAIGMCIVSNEAFVAGIASIPEPFTDSDWSGWLVWRSFGYRFEFADATGVNFPNWTFEVDSKAMRRMGVNDVLVTIAESQGGAYTINSPIRTLLKLS